MVLDNASRMLRVSKARLERAWCGQDMRICGVFNKKGIGILTSRRTVFGCNQEHISYRLR